MQTWSSKKLRSELWWLNYAPWSVEGLWGRNKGFTAVLEKQMEEWELHHFQLQPYWEIIKNFKRFWQHCCVWDGHDYPGQQHLLSSSLQSSQEWVITCVRAAEGVEWHLTSWFKAATCCYKEKLRKWEEWELRKILKDKEGEKSRRLPEKKEAWVRKKGLTWENMKKEEFKEWNGERRD